MSLVLLPLAAHLGLGQRHQFPHLGGCHGTQQDGLRLLEGGSRKAGDL